MGLIRSIFHGGDPGPGIIHEVKIGSQRKGHIFLGSPGKGWGCIETVYIVPTIKVASTYAGAQLLTPVRTNVGPTIHIF